MSWFRRSKPPPPPLTERFNTMRGVRETFIKNDFKKVVCTTEDRQEVFFYFVDF